MSSNTFSDAIVQRTSIAIDSPCECEHNNPDSLDARLLFHCGVSRESGLLCSHSHWESIDRQASGGKAQGDTAAPGHRG